MFDIRHHERIGSTNDEARRLARDGAPHGTVVHADEQTAGRGRLQRGWYSPPGNLYLSIVLRPEVPLERRGELSFIAALAVVDALDTLLPKTVRSALKWPNDVLVDGGKISGILIESDGDAAIVGIGVNILHAPHNVAYKTSTVVGSKGIASVDAARDKLLERLGARLQQWKAEGFAAIRLAWLDRAHPIGTPLRVSTGNHVQEGAFRGLDTDGALLLEIEGATKRVVAGDVAG